MIERVHLQFCKRLLGVKSSTQNEFVYGELGRTNLITRRYLSIVKYWFKILMASENKYISLVYKIMVNDLERQPITTNWALTCETFTTFTGFLRSLVTTRGREF